MEQFIRFIDVNALSEIHNLTASTNETIEAMDRILSSDEETYCIPRETLRSLRNILAGHAIVTSNLTEKMLLVNDIFEDAIKEE